LRAPVKEIPPRLSVQIRTFYHHLWVSHKGTEEERTLARVSLPLRQDLGMQLHGTLLLRSQLFNGLSTEFVTCVAAKLRQRYLSRREIVVCAGDVCHSLFLVKHGELELVDAHDAQLLVIATGSLFGESNVLHTHPRAQLLTLRAVCERNEVYSLVSHDMQDVLCKFPLDSKRFHEHNVATLLEQAKRFDRAMAQLVEHRAAGGAAGGDAASAAASSVASAAAAKSALSRGVQKKAWVEHPESPCRLRWSLVLVLGFLVYAFSVPAMLAFTRDAESSAMDAGRFQAFYTALAFNYVVDLVFLVELYR
jgi:CRP-like cAMP-binding protein